MRVGQELPVDPDLRTKGAIAILDLIPISEAAKLLRVHPETLRRHETPDGGCTIYGERLKVFRLSNEPGAAAQRRYDRNEIMRVLARMAR